VPAWMRATARVSPFTSTTFGHIETEGSSGLDIALFERRLCRKSGKFSTLDEDLSSDYNFSQVDEEFYW